MYRAYFIIFIVFGLVTQISAQTIAEIKADNKYMWGQGKAKNLRKADDAALRDLTGQISTVVESKYSYVVHEEGDNFKETLDGIVNTYSGATLTFAMRVVEEGDDGIITVLRYMERSQMTNIFEKRGKKIKGYVANAVSAEQEGRVGDALRYYFWAQTLLSSHPDNQDMFLEVDGFEQMLYSWIPDRINRIFTLLEIEIVDINEFNRRKEILFNVKFKNQKAYNLDYTYWTGSDWTSMTGASNGKGLIELFGDAECSMENIRIKIEYEYLNKSRMDPELPGVIEVSDLPYYKKAVKQLDLANYSPVPEQNQQKFILAESNIPVTNSMAVAPHMDVTKQPATSKQSSTNTNQAASTNSGAVYEAQTKETTSNVEPETQTATQNEKQAEITTDVKQEPVADNTPPTPTAAKTETPKPKGLTNEYLMASLERIVEALENENGLEVDTLFTDEARGIFNKLIKYGNAKRLPLTSEIKIQKMENYTLVRSVPFVFNFQNNNRKFIENLSFSFNDEGKVNNLSFALNDLSLEGILRHSKWSDASKWHIIDFVENYKTAYALERLDYINAVFDNNALIIVGRKIEQGEPINDIYKSSLSNDQFEFVQVSKKEYIDRLKRVFSANEFVNIQFEECTIKKRDRNSEVYGIQLAQNYFSTNYADKGYLFLMIDVGNPNEPKIYVRSWQPEKNEDGSIMGLGVFFN